LTEVTGIDHIYIAGSELARSGPFYDCVLRPARVQSAHEPHPPGLRYFCLCVDSVEGMHTVARDLRAVDIAATEARLYPQYSDDDCATFFEDPDGVRLEVSHWRPERRQRAAHWDDPVA